VVLRQQFLDGECGWVLLLALDHRTEGFWTIAVLGVVVLVLVFMIVVKGIYVRYGKK